MPDDPDRVAVAVLLGRPCGGGSGKNLVIFCLEDVNAEEAFRVRFLNFLICPDDARCLLSA